MTKIQITCSSEFIKWLIPAVANAEQVLGETVGIDFPIDLPIRTVKQHKARVQYRVVDIASATATLQSLGAHTIMGILFKDLADATVAGQPLTARAIREKRPALKDTTIQTDLVKLRQSGLIVSEAIDE